jgi:hypothetical protein
LSVGAFSADWLALREPADARARSTAVVDAIRESSRGGSSFSRDAGATLRIVDLGAGTGANLRYLAPRLGGAQEWLLVDSDHGLLEAAGAALTQWASALGATVAEREREITIAAADFTCTALTVELDLARRFSALALPRDCLVTAAALLDLVSEAWLEMLADACHDARARVLFALTYDGRLALDPAEPDDELARAYFNRHQHLDKGFGPALGPDAPARASAAFARRGYALTTAESDWLIGGEARRLQAELVDGWLDAALEIEPSSRRALERWHARHRRRIDAGESTLVVGHSDLAGRLIG